MGQRVSQGSLNLPLNRKRLLFRPTWSFFNFPIPEKPHGCWKDGTLKIVNGEIVEHIPKFVSKLYFELIDPRQALMFFFSVFFFSVPVEMPVNRYKSALSKTRKTAR